MTGSRATIHQEHRQDSQQLFYDDNIRPNWNMSSHVSEIRRFLDKICVDFGFCLPQADVDRLSSRDEYVADDFIREIFEIEGLNPDLNLRLFRQVKVQFTDKYGNKYINNTSDFSER